MHTVPLKRGIGTDREGGWSKSEVPLDKQHNVTKRPKFVPKAVGEVNDVLVLLSSFSIHVLEGRQGAALQTADIAREPRTHLK